MRSAFATVSRKHKFLRRGLAKHFTVFGIGLFLCFFLNTLVIKHSSAVEPSSSNAGSTGSSQNFAQVGENSNQALGLGASYYHLGQYAQAIALWQQDLKSATTADAKATIYCNIAVAHLQSGQLGQAIAAWEQAARIYRDTPGKQAENRLAKVLTDQAQAYNGLGQFRQAIPLLKTAIEVAMRHQEQKTTIVAQGVLGNAYAVSGNYEQALSAYRASLKLATATNERTAQVTALNNQVNTLAVLAAKHRSFAQSAQREGNDQEVRRLSKLAANYQRSALTAADQAMQISQSSDGIPKFNALLNAIRFGDKLQPKAIASYQQQAVSLLEKLPVSRSKARALIQLATVEPELSEAHKIKHLQQAITLSRSIGDRYTESFALGTLGQFYELSGKLPTAMETTQQAQFAAQQIGAFDSLYRWQWQAGRIYKASGLLAEATSAYEQAISSLQKIRGDIAVANQELQLDVRDRVEPIYRELLALLLEDSVQQTNIKSALQYSSLLQLTELQNYFGDECLEVKQALDQSVIAKPNEALINSIVLDQKTYTILQLADGTLKSYPVGLTAKELQTEIDRLRLLLEDRATEEYLEASQKIYNLLLRPMMPDLERAKLKTLIFVNDGVLRNVPMAALHDGNNFLVEKYSIVYSLGFNVAARSQQQQKALIFGLTMEMPPFAPLPGTEVETKLVQDIIGGKRYLDEEFTWKNLQQQVQQENYSVVHLATHGEFGGTADTTFLQAYDRRISLKDFELVLSERNQPIDLLTLSACQTAAGNDRSTLGVAGLAARNSVANTLASLWFVNDADIVPLVEDFYTQLQTSGISKAEALRNAQLKLIKGQNRQHPSIWSAFILINS